MKLFFKLLILLGLSATSSGCLVTSVVSGAVSAVTTTVGAAVDVVDAVTPDILD